MNSIYLSLTVSIISTAAIYFLVASGLALIFGLMDVVNIAHAAFIVIGPYAVLELMSLMDGGVTPGIALFLGVCGAMLLASGAGIVVERLFVRPFYGDHLKQILSTLGVALIVPVICGAIVGFEPKVLTLPAGWDAVFRLDGAYIPITQLITIGVGICVWTGLVFLLKFTNMGVIVRAGLTNSKMVQGLGINIYNTFLMIFALGAVLAALGGILASIQTPGVTVALGINLLILSFVVVIIGGLKSIGGCVLSSIAVSAVEELGTFFGPAGTGEILVFILLGIVLLIPTARRSVGT